MDPDVAAWLVELGVIRPNAAGRFTSGDVRRLGLIEALRASGIPDDVIAGEVTRGSLALDFFDNPNFEIFTALTDTTFTSLAAERGLPVELLLVIREAIGAAIPQPTDRVREIELTIVPLIEAMLAAGYEQPAIVRLLRTAGEGLRRFLLAEADAFRRYVIGPVGDRPGSEISAASERAVERLSPPLEAATLSILRAQRANAWTSNMIEGISFGLAAAGIHGSVDRPPAMCFLDITGYTTLTAEHGDDVAADVADTLGRLVHRISVAHGGRPVKWLGDGVMLHFRDPGPATVAALEMAEAAVTAGLPPAHVGLHAGPVVFQNGDYYGQTVNLAARIAGYARPGEVLVSDMVVAAAGDVPVAFTDLGPAELKGVPGRVRLFAARSVVPS